MQISKFKHSFFFSKKIKFYFSNSSEFKYILLYKNIIGTFIRTYPLNIVFIFQNVNYLLAYIQHISYVFELRSSHTTV